jgi:hypothetical protein
MFSLCALKWSCSVDFETKRALRARWFFTDLHKQNIRSAWGADGGGW